MQINTKILRQRMKQRRKTITSMSRRLGISPATAHRRLAGQCPWRQTEIESLCRWLRINRDDLSAGK